MLERTAQILQNSSASKCASPIPARLLTPSRKSVGEQHHFFFSEEPLSWFQMPHLFVFCNHKN
jgi:hypothetical protein